MERETAEQKANRKYKNICECRNCHEQFLFTETLAREIGFGLTDKICPKCGSSQITFIKFADSNVRSYVDKFKMPYIRS